MNTLPLLVPINRHGNGEPPATWVRRMPPWLWVIPVRLVGSSKTVKLTLRSPRLELVQQKTDIYRCRP